MSVTTATEPPTKHRMQSWNQYEYYEEPLAFESHVMENLSE